MARSDEKRFAWLSEIFWHHAPEGGLPARWTIVFRDWTNGPSDGPWDVDLIRRAIDAAMDVEEKEHEDDRLEE